MQITEGSKVQTGSSHARPRGSWRALKTESRAERAGGGGGQILQVPPPGKEVGFLDVRVSVGSEMT